jgi:hypothetical protein
MDLFGNLLLPTSMMLEFQGRGMQGLLKLSGPSSSMMSQNLQDARVHSQVENLRRSGFSESNILAEALEHYKLKHPKGHSFTFLYCWYLLRNVPRWVDFSVTECRKSQRVPAQGRGYREMPHSSELESECAFPDQAGSRKTAF